MRRAYKDNWCEPCMTTHMYKPRSIRLTASLGYVRKILRDILKKIKQLWKENSRPCLVPCFSPRLCFFRIHTCRVPFAQNLSLAAVRLSLPFDHVTHGTMEVTYGSGVVPGPTHPSNELIKVHFWWLAETDSGIGANTVSSRQGKLEGGCRPHVGHQQLITQSEMLSNFSAAIWNPLETHVFGQDRFFSD